MFILKNNKKLIVNADDFGFSQEVNEGVKKAILAGSVMSVSVMVTMPYFADAVQFLNKHQNVSVGLHFNLTEGKRYHGLFLTMISLIVGKISTEYVKKELLYQYVKLKQTGLPISHIDSHEHIHAYPVIFKLMHDFAAKNNIPRLRGCHVSFHQLINAMRDFSTGKQLLLWTMYSVDGYLFQRDKRTIPYSTDSLFDLNWCNDYTHKHISQLFADLQPGTTELICHLFSKTSNNSLNRNRYKCLQFLIYNFDSILKVFRIDNRNLN